MKKILYNIILCLFVTSMANAQSDGVTFLPGLGENETVWSGMSAELQQQYVYSDRYQGYYGYDAINTATNTINIPTGEVVVAHSQGGLLAREYLDDRTPGNFKALVTVGTPHKGAPIVTSTLDGTVSAVFGNWIRYLALGFYAYFGSGQTFRQK